MIPLASIADDAMDAYIYGFPIVLTETTRRNMRAAGIPTNRFAYETAFPGPGTGIVVRPNVDTLYVMSWLDLSSEPLVLRTPDTGGKYYVLEFLDDWTNVFASVGPRTTGAQAQEYLIAGPGWRGGSPQGLPAIVSPTNTVWLLGRIQTDGPGDIDAVHALQQGFLLAPLGYWIKYGMQGISNVAVESTSSRLPPPKEQVAALGGAAFFTILAHAMAANPPAPDPPMDAKLAALGLTSGAKFEFGALPPPIRQALDAAAQAGPGMIRAKSMEYYAGIQADGWALPLTDVGIYGTNYMERAIVAMNFLGANVPEDAVYGFTYLDGNGEPLSGPNRYRIHFGAGQLPPVNAFWSVTLYNRNGFFIRNPIGRYAVAPHLGALSYNPDGSLDILIQHRAPDRAMFPNWLPAPKGSFNLLLRMYWPGPGILNGTWKTPAVLPY